MGMDTVVRRGHPIAFSILLLFSIIEIAISSWLVSRYNSHHNYRNFTNRDRVRYTLFASTWTVVGSIFYLILFLHSPDGSILTSVASHLVFLSLTWIIWTAAAISITTMLSGGLNCSTQKTFVYCGQLNALEGFAWMIWIIVTVVLIIVLIRGISAARRGDGYRGQLVMA
ncbi:hypothetical protein L208DRAFT_1462280 [Tricholoma matsutake]|nr:hypothetical protein L208DRAFT_1462280 [Tricholoma matsutake 945]